MTVKTSGAEFKAFYEDDKYWPNDFGQTYHEDECLSVDGEVFEEDYVSIPDDAKVTICGGIVYSPKWSRESAPSFETYFKRWRTLRDTVVVVAEVNKEQVEAVKDFIKSIGGKVK